MKKQAKQIKPLSPIKAVVMLGVLFIVGGMFLYAGYLLITSVIPYATGDDCTILRDQLAFDTTSSQDDKMIMIQLMKEKECF